MELPHIYSYVASFEDGTNISYKHLEERDISQVVENGSRFSDVLHKSKTSKLISFILFNEERAVAVDLRDGHFEVNGEPFFQHRPDLETYTDFRIIFYRTCVYVKTPGQEDTGYIAQYCVGWQSSDENGNNVQRFIAV